MRMLANRTDSEERLVSELLGKVSHNISLTPMPSFRSSSYHRHDHRGRCLQNADLQRKLDDIKEYIIAASADGWIGKDDPVYHEFNLHIVRCVQYNSHVRPASNNELIVLRLQA